MMMTSSSHDERLSSMVHRARRELSIDQRWVMSTTERIFMVTVLFVLIYTLIMMFAVRRCSGLSMYRTTQVMAFQRPSHRLYSTTLITLKGKSDDELNPAIRAKDVEIPMDK